MVKKSKITKAQLKKKEARIEKRRLKQLWKDLQQQVLERDKHRCVFCGKEVHPKHFQTCHIIPYEFKETRYDINNLLLACFYHHKIGKYSIHKHPLWVTLWLETNRPEQYKYLLNRFNDIEKMKGGQT